MNHRTALCTLAATLLLAACALPGAKDVPLATYDFGPAPLAAKPDQTQSSLRPTLIVADVVAPAWLDANFMFYRLAYSNVQQPMPYAHSRWAMSPPQLMTQRAKLRLARFANVLSAGDASQGSLLRLEMQEFSQIFDTPGSSRGMLHMRASLIAKGAVLAQRSFALAPAAPTANAAGGVQALTEASDRMLDELAAWLEVQLR